jgi:glycosyltransferase involved in cell wall biosynthesis
VDFHHGCQCTVAETPTSQALLRSMGGPEAVVIPKGVDSLQFSPARRDPSCRAAWQAGVDDLVVFWAGRMVATKGLDLLAQVGNAVRARLPSLRLVCAGEGPEAASVRAALPWATFSGLLQGEALATAYASADIFSFTSPDEPWGNVLLEAAASGLAIVARSGGAAVDLLRPAGACVAPLPQDAAAFSAALLRLAGDPAERRRLGQAARRAAVASSMTRCAERWVEMWAGLSRRETPT